MPQEEESFSVIM